MKTNFSSFTVNISKPRRSKGYFATLDLSNKDDVEFLEEIRKDISQENKSNKLSGSKSRGMVQVRNAKPIHGGLIWDKNRNLVVSKNNVDFVDVYVYYY